MHPVFFKIGPITIHWYGVLMATGFFAGLLSWCLIGRRENRTVNFCSDLLFWIMVSGVLGARLAYVVADWRYFLDHPTLIYRLDLGGLIYYGGMIASTIAVYVFARTRREKVLHLYDFVATSLPLAHAFGRLGCFMNGCCHGTPTHGPLGVTFPAGSFAWDRQVRMGLIQRTAERSLPVHPVQLYEASFDLLLYALLAWLYLRRKRNGLTTAFYLMIYPIGRLVLECFRGDERLTAGGLTFAQILSLLVASGLTLLVATRRKPPEPANI